MEMINVDGVNIRLHSQGPAAGLPIVYLHSASAEVCSLDFFDRLNEQGYRVMVPELPGCGGSDLPKVPWRGIEDVIYHLRRTLDRISDRPVVLIGSSLGGWFAAEMAVWYPEKVRAAVLIGAVGLYIESDPIFNIFGEPGALDHQAELMRRANPHGFDFMPILAGAVSDGNMPPEHALLIHMLRGQAAAVRIGWNPYLHDPKLLNRLKHVRSPSLVLRGADDGIVPPKHAEVYAGEIPGARLEQVPQCGHMPVLEKPRETADKILNFLSSIL